LELRKGSKIRNQRAWIFTVAHNCSIDAATQDKPAEELHPDLFAGLKTPGPDPEQAVLEQERMIRFQNAVNELPDLQRRCLSLRAAGFGYREIAEMIGVKASTVGESLRRAICRLKGGSL